MADDTKELGVTDRRASKTTESEVKRPCGCASNPEASAWSTKPGDQSPQPPPIDFSTFIMSLATSALMQLGLARPMDGEPSPPDLPMARETIDILGMLQEKTCGNLTDQEALLLQNLLFDLRLQFVDVSSGARGPRT